jgi:hypothetical protein
LQSNHQTLATQDIAVHPVGEIPEKLYCFGNLDLLHKTRAAVLNSRVGHRVTSEDFWIKKTKIIVEEIATRDLALVSSYNTLPYSLVNSMWYGRPLIIVCDEPLPFQPETRRKQFLKTYHDAFDLENTLFISPFDPIVKIPPSKRYRIRDKLIAAIAHYIFPGVIRKAGNFEKIVADYASKILNCGPDQDPSRPARKRTSKNPAPQMPKNESSDLFRNENFLFHYTRSKPGPWPDQTIHEYCKSLVAGHIGCGHTAFDTLEKILHERQIKGNSGLVRGNRPVVCFTECPPHAIHKINKWRPGLLRWSFEPYGIAIPKKTILESGGRPVMYGAERSFRFMDEDEKYLFQPVDKIDWTAEREWRLMGNLALVQRIWSDLVVIVTGSQEQNIIKEQFGLPTVLFSGE